MKSKKNNKHKWSFIKQMLILAVLAAPFLYVICVVFLEPVVPRTRTYFKNHQKFCEVVGVYYLRRTLPESAQNVKYCYSVNFFKKGSGYCCVLSDEEYGTIPEECLNHLVTKCENLSGIATQYIANSDEQKQVLYETDFDGTLHFLEKLISEEQKDNYYYLCYYEFKLSDEHLIFGVIVNDVTNQLIEFQYREPIGPAW